MEEKDYKVRFEELESKHYKLSDSYDKLYREKCDADATNRELKSMNNRLLKIIENLSEGLTQ